MEEEEDTNSSPLSMESMTLRRHSTDQEHSVSHRSSSRRRMSRPIIDHHRCSSDVDDDDADHQYNHPTMVPNQLDFCDVFGGPPRSSTILHRRFSADERGTTSRNIIHAAASSRTSTNFYDEIFCPAPQPNHHPAAPDPGHPYRHGHGGRSMGGAGYFLHSRQQPMRSSSRSLINICRSLPGFSIPSSSSSSSTAGSSVAETTARAVRRSEAKTSGFFARTEVGFYDDIFGCGNIDDRAKSKFKSRPRSKAAADSSTSVLCSEDIPIMSPPVPSHLHPMPHPPVAAYRNHHHHCHHHHHKEEEQEDAIVSSFTSKLRPITIPIRSTRTRTSKGYEYDSTPPSTVLSGGGDAEDANSSWGTMRSTSSLPPPSSEKRCSFINSNFLQQYCYSHHQRRGCQTCHDVCFSPPPDDHTTFHVVDAIDSRDYMCDYYAPGSPSSVNAAVQVQEESAMEKKIVVVQEDREIGGGGDQIGSSFVKEIDQYGNRANHVMTMMMGETEGAAAVDEAIAWVKEKFGNGEGPAAGF